ncbi:MAG TPA: hypothetical protein VN664_01380 [Burkholderiales bacterium]|jgi:hypothetical protein|nr:hypothetical protein [Burkholderiales bacterium]
MQTEVSESQRTARAAALKGFSVGVVVVGLIALVAVAAIRETAKPRQVEVATNSAFGHSERPPMTAAEETYAHALWPVHAQVKQDAVKMTFAGLAYKMGDIKRAAVKDRVALLTPKFESALTEINKLQPPASMRELHSEYVEAIKLYRDASVIMVKVAADGRDVHLAEAQERSERASTLTLKVGDTLWPGEYKPN